MSHGKHRYADRRLWWFRTWELVRTNPAYHAELYRYWLRQDCTVSEHLDAVYSAVRCPGCGPEPTKDDLTGGAA